MFIGHDLSVVKYISDRILVMYLGEVIEMAETEELFSHTLHPYTKALISAIPLPTTEKQDDRILLEGDIPSTVNPPSGCRFCTRCFMAKEKCRHEHPKLEEIRHGHFTLAGIAVIGYAGSLRARNMSEEEKKAAVKDFALTKGLAVALLAGVMSACFNLGLESGNEVLAKAREAGASDLFALNPVILLVTLGGFCTNAVYCIFQNVKNGTGKDYFSVSGGTLLNNVLFCALAGVLWYSQFFGLGMGKSYFSDSPVMLAFSWSILMSLNVIFSNVWGILLKEWKGVDRRTIVVLITGMCILILSLLYPNIV